MAIFSLVYLLTLPFLVLLTLPLALLAGLTTTIAFSILLFRVFLIYIDVVLSFVGRKPRYLRIHPPRAAPAALTATHSPPSLLTSPSSLQLKRRRRRTSSASVTPAESAPMESALGLIPSVGAERDFEGLGGWRSGDDDAWTAVNSRLEMPDRHYTLTHHHHRSASGGLSTPGDGGYLMMKGRRQSPAASPTRQSVSPNSSRARTPTGPRVAFGGAVHTDGYFPPMASPKATKKAPSQTLG